MNRHWNVGSRILEICYVLLLSVSLTSCTGFLSSSTQKAETPFTKKQREAEPLSANSAKEQVYGMDGAYGRLPLTFEVNHGQTDEQVKFLSRGKGYTLFLTPAEMVLALRKPIASRTGDNTDLTQLITYTDSKVVDQTAALHMKLVGTNHAPKIAGLEEQGGKINYFIGNDPAKWLTRIPTYTRVRYKNIYPGVDLVYYGNRRQLEYDFVVAPGADPSAILLDFGGANKLEVNPKGDLVIHIAGEQIRMHKPLIYQELNGVRQKIAGGYELNKEQQVRFQLASYDTKIPLVIDPILAFSTYLGSESEGLGIAVDAAGNAYVTGGTDLDNFPTANPLQPASGGGKDAFVTKLSPDGALIYSTYLGGSNNEDDSGTLGIAVDGDGNAYVTGDTTSPDFPTVNPIQAALVGERAAYVAKLNSTGSALLYSTYLGGSIFEEGESIAVDATGNAYVVGRTSSSDFPTSNPFQAVFGGSTDAFVTKLNPTGSAFVYSTYLGGSDGDEAHDIAVDEFGNAYITGHTRSIDFPTANALDPSTNGISDDGFVAKLNSTGSMLIYSTFLGGDGRERARGIAVDTFGNTYVTGSTDSADFPIINPFQSTLSGPPDAFVTKLNPTGSAFVFSTYLGGVETEDIIVDSSGNVYVTGGTSSAEFPMINPVQPSLGGQGDAIVVKMDSIGSTLLFSTYLGGGDGDGSTGIGLDASGNIYVTGITLSTDFPTVNPVQSQLDSSASAFVAKFILDQNTPTGSVTISPAIGITISFDVSSSGNTTVTMSGTGPTLPPGFSLGGMPIFYDISTTAIFTPPARICITYDPVQYTDLNNLSLLHYENNTWVDITNENDMSEYFVCGDVGSLSPFVVAETGLSQPPSVDAGGPYTVTEGGSVVVTALGNDPDGGALVYDWDLDNNGSFEVTGQSVTFSSVGLEIPNSQIITVRATDNGGLFATDQTVVNVTYSFTGFFQPVDNLPILNVVKAGRAIPMKFSLDGPQGLNIFAAGYPSSALVACGTTAENAIEETVTAGSSSLSYDANNDQYTYVWKTNQTWAGTCRTLVVRLNDGTHHRANFKFK